MYLITAWELGGVVTDYTEFLSSHRSTIWNTSTWSKNSWTKLSLPTANQLTETTTYDAATKGPAPRRRRPPHLTHHTSFIWYCHSQPELHCTRLIDLKLCYVFFFIICLSVDRLQRPNVYLPVHLYGQLVHDKTGCHLLETQVIATTAQSTMTAEIVYLWCVSSSIPNVRQALFLEFTLTFMLKKK